MIPWKLLDRAPVPGGEGELMLYQRGEEFSIRITRRGELMNSRAQIKGIMPNQCPGQP